MNLRLAENTEQEAALFAALSDPTRLKLVKLLSRRVGGGFLCVCALAASCGVTQSAVSQHLRVLRAVGLVRGERRGYHIHYSVNPEALKKCGEVIASLLDTAHGSDEGLRQHNTCQNTECRRE